MHIDKHGNIIASSRKEKRKTEARRLSWQENHVVRQREFTAETLRIRKYINELYIAINRLKNICIILFIIIIILLFYSISK